MSAEALSGHTCDKPVQRHVNAALYVSGVKLWRRPDVNNRHAVLLRKQQLLRERQGGQPSFPMQRGLHAGSICAGWANMW